MCLESVKKKTKKPTKKPLPFCWKYSCLKSNISNKLRIQETGSERGWFRIVPDFPTHVQHISFMYLLFICLVGFFMLNRKSETKPIILCGHFHFFSGSLYLQIFIFMASGFNLADSLDLISMRSIVRDSKWQAVGGRETPLWFPLWLLTKEIQWPTFLKIKVP